MSFYQSLLPWVYGCALCGRSPSGPTVLACEGCLFDLEQEPPVRSLCVGPNKSPLWGRWIWNKGESGSRVGSLVHSFKGGLRGYYLAQRIAAGLELDSMLRELRAVPIWIPAPPRRLGAVDHAHVWAQALQATYGGFLWAGLRRRSDREEAPQKRADRRQRWQLSLELCQDREPLPPGRPIFCDDVVTTGATWAAVERLISPKVHGRLPGAVIAYRPLVNRV